MRNYHLPHVLHEVLPHSSSQIPILKYMHVLFCFTNNLTIIKMAEVLFISNDMSFATVTVCHPKKGM